MNSHVKKYLARVLFYALPFYLITHFLIGLLYGILTSFVFIKPFWILSFRELSETSATGKWTAFVVTSEKKKGEQQVIVVNQDGSMKTFDLEAAGKHGKVRQMKMLCSMYSDLITFCSIVVVVIIIIISHFHAVEVVS